MRDGDLRLLVFDWDGTLMDSVGAIVACTQAVITELALGEHDPATIRGTVGLGLRETADLLVPGRDGRFFEQVLDCYRRHWVSTYRDQPILFPGVPAMLAELARRGYLLAVATGKSRRGLEYGLTQSGLRAHFHSTRTVDEAAGKPHPQMLLDILDELGVRPAAAAMVGDSIYDLQMAANAGTHAVGVASGAHRREELAALAPHALLERITDLPGWLEAAAGAAAGTSPAVSAARASPVSR